MAIKHVSTFVTEDGKSYDTLDKAISHERRRMIQHLLLDKRESLHLSLADIDKAAAIICAVHGPVAALFEQDLSPDLSGLQKIVDPAVALKVAAPKVAGVGFKSQPPAEIYDKAATTKPLEALDALTRTFDEEMAAAMRHETDANRKVV